MHIASPLSGSATYETGLLREQPGTRLCRAQLSLAQHLALRDLNYLRLQRLLMAGGAQRQHFSFAAQHPNGEELCLQLRKVPQGGGRYTEACQCSLIRRGGHPPTASLALALRIYHDLRSVEVVGCSKDNWAGEPRNPPLLPAERRRLDDIAGEWFAYFIDRGHYPLDDFSHAQPSVSRLPGDD